MVAFPTDSFIFDTTKEIIIGQNNVVVERRRKNTPKQRFPTPPPFLPRKTFPAVLKRLEFEQHFFFFLTRIKLVFFFSPPLPQTG